MAYEFAAEERIRALFTVQGRMLHELWMYVLNKEAEPIEEAHAVESGMVRDLEEAASGLPDREAAQIQQLFIEPLQEMWAAITAELAENEQPIPYLPTAYGLRLAEQHRKQQSRDEQPPRDVGDEPPHGPDDKPDQ